MSESQVNPTQAGDESWDELYQAYITENQFEDAIAVTSSYYYSSDEMQVGPNPTVGSFDSDWILWDNDELEM